MALTATIVASRESGPVPLPVYFEGTTSVDANGDSIDSAGLLTHDILEYTWDFGAGSEGDVGGRYFTGFHAAHAYETAGSYTAKLTVRDASGTADTTVAITVQTRQAYVDSIDPGRTAKSYYVDTTTGDNGDDGLSEGNAWATYAYAFAQFSAFTTLKAGDSLLFKRGETFPYTAGVRYGSCNNIYVGAYGTGADPILQNAGTGTGSASAAIYDYSNGIQMVFTDLEVDGESTADSSLSTIIAVDGSSELLLLRCNFHDCKSAVFNNTSETFLIDCTFGQANDQNLYTVVTRLALINCDIGPVTDEHNLYGNKMEGTVISGNTWTGATLQPDLRISPNWGASYNIVVSDNDFSGASGISIQMNVSHATYGETSNVVIERNILRGLGSKGALHVDALNNDVLVRNNLLINTTAGPALYISENVVNPDRAAVQGLHVYNNTMIMQGVGNVIEVEADDHTDIVIKNNIVVIEEATASNRCFRATSVAAMGEITLDYNLYSVNGQTDLFTDDATDFTLAEWRAEYSEDASSLEGEPTFDGDGTTGYELLAGSPGINVGVTLAEVYEDYDEVSRPQGVAYDIGAFEYSGEEEGEEDGVGNIKTAIFAELAGNSNVTNVVSTRVWLGQAQQNETLPYVVFHRPGNTPEYHMGGQSGLTRGLFQIDCYDDDPDDAHDLSEVIRLALSGQRGTIGTGSHTAVVRRLAMTDSRDFFEEPISKDEKGIYSEKQTWEIWHTLSVP